MVGRESRGWGGGDKGDGGQSSSACVQAAITRHLEQFPLVSGTDERHFNESLKPEAIKSKNHRLLGVWSHTVAAKVSESKGGKGKENQGVLKP